MGENKLCPRCKQNNLKSIRIHHSKVLVNVEKCATCGFIFLKEEEAIKLTGIISKKLFMQKLLGK